MMSVDERMVVAHAADILNREAGTFDPEYFTSVERTFDEIRDVRYRNLQRDSARTLVRILTERAIGTD